MPASQQASANSRVASRLNGVASTMLYPVNIDLYMPNPLWCFVVNTRYLMPAFFGGRNPGLGIKSHGIEPPCQQLILLGGNLLTEHDPFGVPR